MRRAVRVALGSRRIGILCSVAVRFARKHRAIAGAALFASAAISLASDDKAATRDALAIFDAARASADPQAMIRRVLRLERTPSGGQLLRVGEQTYDLSQFQQLVVVGAGKAAVPMAKAAEDALGDRIAAGHVITKHGHWNRVAFPLKHISVTEAGHPVPDENGAQAADSILQFLRSKAHSRTLVLVLISGGGSALMTAPLPGLSLSDLQTVNKALLACGAPIQEVNALRKHLDRVKGGRLAQAAAPSTVVSLILSDVVGDPLDVIASGPTVPDASSFKDCAVIVQKYGIESKLPPAVLEHLRRGLTDASLETPKGTQLPKVQNLIVGSNSIAVAAAAAKAESLGYKTTVIKKPVEGEAREAALTFADWAVQVGSVSREPVCLIGGGETTVTLKGTGKGGRNQELALAASRRLDGAGPNVVVLSAGTDGSDGPTDATGAVVDGATLQRARARGLDAEAFLRNNDSYTFFRQLGDGLIVTGPTGTNVMDVQVALSRPASASAAASAGRAAAPSSSGAKG